MEAGEEEGLWPFLKWGRENVALAPRDRWMWDGKKKRKGEEA